MTYQNTPEYDGLQKRLKNLISKGWFCGGMVLASDYDRYYAIINSENKKRDEYNINHYPEINLV